MSIILCQHGEAVSKEENPERPLTQKGRIKVISIVEKAFKNRKRPGFIYHSSKIRAKQTAEIIEKTLGMTGALIESDKLGPNDDPEIFLKSIVLNHDILIVGHLPFLKVMASFLIKGTKREHVTNFQNGCLIYFQKKEGSDYWEIDWSEF